MNDEIRIARRWLEQRPVFLDTETTGLDGSAEACEIAIVDFDGSTLLDTLVQPTVAIPNAAIAIHGITNTMVASAPTFSDLRADLYRILHGRLCIIYNAAFDMRILTQSAIAADCYVAWPKIGAVCAMLLYADYRGEWDEYHGNNRWFKLEVACTLEHIITTGTKAHRAAGDAEMTRRLVEHIAGRHMLWEQQIQPMTAKGATV